MSEIEYTIVVPVYRSVETLEFLFLGIRKLFVELNYSFEVVFVEDSGSEESWQELLRLKQLNPDLIRIIRLSKNFGQNGTTLCGIDEAKGKKVITIDDDLQIEPKEIVKLINHHNETGSDVVYGKIPDQKTSWLRRKGSNFIKRIFNKSQGGSSIGSSFRLIDGHIIEKLRFHSQDHLFINQVITWYTLNYQFVEVEHSSRGEGKSGYSLWKLTLLSLKLIIYYTSLPLKLMILLSFIAAGGILGLSAYYIYFKSTKGESLDLFMVAVLVSMGIISASIGIFGVYINRIYSSRVRKPNYAIKIRM
ncbi:MAG: glycosyltransferase involved in cell wall biosynthesis [Flavobacteriaceae bacterium]|jgi:glycosyltransferase involved in cell wall biosynthesis